MKVAVVGCSFAGLSFSYFLNKINSDIDLTLFDKKPKIGMFRTSACCTSTNILNELSAKESVLRKFSRLLIHYKDNKFEFKHPQYATFDYFKLCNLIKRKISGNFNLGTSVDVETLKKNYDLVVDCSGYSSKIDKNKRLAFGLEKEIRIKDLDSNMPHIFLGKHVIEGGYGWCFPTLKNTFRVGIIGYKKIDFKKKLDEFLNNFNCEEVGGLTGGFVAYGLTNKIIQDNIICLGDSASQTLPISFEGIRPTFLYSKLLSRLVSDYKDNKISFKEMTDYYVKSNRISIYSYLLKSQKIALNISDLTFNILIKTAFRNKPAYSKFSKGYFKSLNKIALFEY